MLVWLGLLVAVVVGIQVGGSLLLAGLANRKLEQGDDYVGTVSTLGLPWWRGLITVGEFTYHHRGVEGDRPLVRMHNVAMTPSLDALLQGRLGGSVEVEEVELNFVKRERFSGPGEAAERAGEQAGEAAQEAKTWQRALRSALPLEITHLEVKQGQVRYVDGTHSPPVDVGLRQLHVEANDLRNRPDGEELPSRVHLTAITTGNGTLEVEIAADPVAVPPRFECTLALRGMELPALNNFMRTYTGMDVSAGTFDLDLQVRAEGGAYEGFTKPFFRDLDFTNLEDKEKPALKRLAESAVDAVAGLLENDETDKVATAVPFSGTFENNQADIWTAIENLLRNAFIEAIREGIKQQTPLE